MSSLSDINSFLPAYPAITARKDDLFTLFPEGFANAINSKKELAKYTTLPKSLIKKSEEFEAQPHQLFVSRYVSGFTPYENQLIVHSMGTGKTALAILTVENALKNGFKGALICVPSNKFFKSFITEIVNITKRKYFPDNYLDLGDAQLQRAIKKNIRETYELLTYKKFANRVEKARNDGIDIARVINEEYSNRVIIADEVHNLRIQPDKKAETAKTNESFKLLCHSVSNCKILLMTGTPMKDRWEELPDLLNLILPMDKQLPTGKRFVEKYPNDGASIENSQELKEQIRGMISTLRTIPSDVPREYIGELTSGLNVFRVDVGEMSEFQEKYYMRAYEIDESKDRTGIRDKSRQASLFIFPDGSYGKVGFQMYTIEVKKPVKQPGQKRAKRGSNTYEIPKLTSELISAITREIQQDPRIQDFPEIKNPDHRKYLRNLSKFSATYAKSIRDILLGGNTYIYNEFVDGSGVMLFARILELFGYSRSVFGSEKTEAKRYCLLTSKTLDDQGTIVANVQKTFNDPSLGNVEGKYIQVIIGSKTSGEGLSFYNVENIGVHTPWWNYSTIDQAIARGVRYRSHDEIRKVFRSKGLEFKVKIHHYASTPQDRTLSIDIKLYLSSEDKDRQIKVGERLLKEISYDCGANKVINMRGINGSRDCEYLNCEYKCDGLAEEKKDASDEDHSSYNYYYSYEEELVIRNKVIEMFQNTFSLNLIEIQTRLNESGVNHHSFVVVKTLKGIIDRLIVIPNKFGFKSYLREHNNVYFLVNSMNKPSSALVSYYTSFPAVKEVISFDGYLDTVRFNYSSTLLDLINEKSRNEINFPQVQIYLSHLPDTIRESILENVIDVDMSGHGDQEHAEFRKWLLDLYKGSIHRLENGTIVSTHIEGLVSCRNLEGVWNDCTDDEKIMDEILKKKKDFVQEIESNPYGYTGRVDKIKIKDGYTKGFWIKDVAEDKKRDGKDARKKMKGAVCGTGQWDKGRLASIAYIMGGSGPAQKDTSRKQLLDTLSKAKFSSEIHLEEMSDNELKRLSDLFKLTKEGLCKVIHDIMEVKKLIEYV